MSVGPHQTRTPAPAATIHLRKIAAWPGIRVLAWDGTVLYGCRGYRLISMQTASLNGGEAAQWQSVADFRPAWWRNITSRFGITYRLVRDGFHALAILENGSMVAPVPGAIVARTPASSEFHITHKILRGTRPLHIAVVPGGNIYWGEYFDNRERDEVHIYASADRGQTWHVAHTFAAGDIRHVHNIVYDPWGDCLWILTGDEGSECKILRASCDLRSIDTVLAGNQQTRSVAVLPSEEALYLSTDTPSEKNHIVRVDRVGHVEQIFTLGSSSIFGGRTANALFFSTMAEPSVVNSSREVHLVGSADGTDWQRLARWKKDSLSMRYFQYGNAILPDGENTTNYLAATTVAVEHEDGVATLWEVELTAANRGPKVGDHAQEMQRPPA